MSSAGRGPRRRVGGSELERRRHLERRLLVRSASMAFVLHLGLAAAAADLERTALIDLARATTLSGWAPPHR